MAFRWLAVDGPTLNDGLVALYLFRGSRPVLLRNTVFCDFKGVRESGAPVSLDPRMMSARTLNGDVLLLCDKYKHFMSFALSLDLELYTVLV